MNTDEIRNVIMNGTEETKPKQFYAPTGSFLLDLCVGGGVGYGYPYGKIINIVGDKAASKSFLLCELIAANYYRYGKNFKWVYDDCESGFTFDTKNLYGFEIMPQDSAERTKSSTVEELYVNVRSFAESLKPNEVGIYGVDSLDGLTSKELDELADEHYKKAQEGKEAKQNSYRMGKAKYLSQEFFPQMAGILEKTNCLLVIISQVRENVEPMSFEKYVRTGGKAMDFYAHTVLWLAMVNKVKAKGIVVGATIKAKTTKSKTPRPFREIYFDLKFDYGVDDIATNLDYLFDFRTDKGELVKGAEASWDGKELNLENLKQFLIENGVEEEYRKTVKPTLKKSEVVEWLSNNEKLKDKFNQQFMAKMGRNELISFIENNHLEKELQKRVEEKWETIEKSVATNRPRKYSLI